MIGAIAQLFVCLLAGEAIHRVTGLALPGSVIGLGLLLLWLGLVRRQRPSLGLVTGWLTAHLSIMLLPPAIGVIDQGAMLSRYGVGIVVATVVSTLLTLVVSVWVFIWVSRLVGSKDETAPPAEPAP